MKRTLFRIVAVMSAALGISGCTSVAYYAQSLAGHAEIMSARQSVQKLAESPSTPRPLRDRMMAARDLRRFATEALALPDNNSYRSYVDIGRDQVTVAVFAAPEFSLTPQTWCFPVFGCVPYRGYFAEKSAAEAAEKLRNQGFDVHLSGITAYSTLGWSSDPLLSTMLAHDDTYLAGLMFHELAHQRVYVNDDSEFNEAFAVAVEMTGVRTWLRTRGDAEGLRRYDTGLKRKADFLALISKTRDELTEIYGAPTTSEEKRIAKAAAFERLRARYRTLRDRRWGGDRAYDAWFEAPMNNAKIAATSVYQENVPAFLRLFDLCSGEYPRFYEAVRQLGALRKEHRATALASANGCYSAHDS